MELCYEETSNVTSAGKEEAMVLIHEKGKRPVSEVEQKLAALRKELVEHRNALGQKYATLPVTDPRRVVARHIRAIAGSAYLSWIFLEDELREPAWWQHQFNVIPPAAQDDVHDYEVFVAATSVLYPFSLFEAGVRRIVRSIDSTACAGATAEFKSIYDWLLARMRRDGWAFSQGDATAFLDLYRNVRNTLHNNGHLYSPKARNVTIEWRGVDYDFVHAQPPPFINWDFNVMLVRDLGQLNREIMEAPLVAVLLPIA
jgi:hypothetical protein